MDPVSPLPAITCLLAAIATAFLLVRHFGAPPDQGRFASIDGLRGYLAFFVFLYHSCVWYFYLRTGHWNVPPSNLYTHFGESSVLLFFMITGFLFFSKLIDGRTKSIDWGKLFVSRFLRLVPLYLFVIFLLFLVVAYLSKGEIKEPIPKLLNEAIQWLSFTIPGGPNLNGVANTFIITAGVTWSLPYEWIFYLSLPLLALTVRVTPPLPYIALSIAVIVGLAIWHPAHIHSLILVPFFGGITASLLVRSDLFRRFAVRRISSFISLGCIALAVTFYPSAFEAVPLLLLSVAFVLIACGNNMYGVLVSPISRTLGEMAYSIYLLHGITLFIFFNFILGITASRELTPLAHWLLVAGITPVLLSLCFLTFRYIESPAMRSTTTFTAWLRSRATLRAKGASQAEHP
jgi:peptidoglycan/LPS O-acetylase OafA/YrhL